MPLGRSSAAITLTLVFGTMEWATRTTSTDTQTFSDAGDRLRSAWGIKLMAWLCHPASINMLMDMRAFKIMKMKLVLCLALVLGGAILCFCNSVRGDETGANPTAKI